MEDFGRDLRNGLLAVGAVGALIALAVGFVLGRLTS